MSIRVYIAGPLSAPDHAGVLQRVNAAIDAADDVWQQSKKQGVRLAPVVPHLCVAWHARHPHDYEDWIDYDFLLLGGCHALLRLPGTSPGANREVQHVQAHGLPVFYSADALMAWARALGSTTPKTLDERRA